MEVAGQWRREWAGTAEYGKVTEGGVTRHVARAMEVLHASAPGARVRVMRAAYHSSAGPGVPAASYLMHSSRRVISSGFNLLESPITPSKPLEISSTPMDSSPDYNTDPENYKVTEPDDFEISEPSKWRSSTAGSSIRIPSEESSSTDNASIIDLDSRHRSIFRKHSYDSESSDIPLSRRGSSRLSPLLDSPVALSTLKYKSLLNGSSDWTNRRKSYSFEDTSPLNETILHSNDTLAMESSTDSGICKSTEIVNESDEKCYDRKDKKNYDRQEETFKDWLSKNRPTSSFYKVGHFKPRREHDIVMEDPHENNISLQSKGKVTITVPITLETEEDYQQRKNQGGDDSDRKVKKVEFCKTELHFTAESGKVNIIATDEKPPPSNDFRKRRSAFVPIHGNFEKPITLFGENNKDYLEAKPKELPTCINGETGELDENTAATKSILKNKIPKPKPYLLGENMVFGRSAEGVIDNKNDTSYESTVPTAVSLINKQLQERRCSNDTTSSETDVGVIKNNAFRTTDKSPSINDTFKLRRTNFDHNETTYFNRNSTETNPSSVRNKLRALQISPVQERAKTRQLKNSDLMYFGVSSNPKTSPDKTKYETRPQYRKSSVDDLFQSVKLIQKVTNSVCNSEAESEDSPEYQNIPLKTNFVPIPTPMPRSIYDNNSSDLKPLKPVIENNYEPIANVIEWRRSRLRRQDEAAVITSRSISAPPKTSVKNSEEKPKTGEASSQALGKISPSLRTKRTHATRDRISEVKKTSRSSRANCYSPKDEPLYINLKNEEENNKNSIQRTSSIRRKLDELKPNKAADVTAAHENNSESRRSRIHRNYERQENKAKINPSRENSERYKDSKGKKEDSINKTTRAKRTQKLSTPDYSNDKIHSSSPTRRTPSSEKVHEKSSSDKSKHEHRAGSSQKHRTKTSAERLTNEEEPKADSKQKTIIKEKEKEVEKHRTRESAKDKKDSHREMVKIYKPHVKDENYNHATKTKGKEVMSTETNSNAKSDRASKRSEYVINYDDKNGTVSSICKVPGSSTSKKKKVSKERAIDNSKEYKVKNKTSEKIALRNAVARSPMGSMPDDLRG